MWHQVWKDHMQIIHENAICILIVLAMMWQCDTKVGFLIHIFQSNLNMNRLVILKLSVSIYRMHVNKPVNIAVDVKLQELLLDISIACST